MANHEEEFAVAQIKASAIKKQVNAASWNDDYENLLASWGEKAAGLRYMHGNSSGYWRSVSNNLKNSQISRRSFILQQKTTLTIAFLNIL